MPSHSLSAAEQQALDNYARIHKTLTEERVLLDTELIRLNTIPSPTTEQNDRKIVITNRISQITIALADLAKKEDTSVVSDRDLVLEQARQDLFNKITETLPAPPTGTFVIIHPSTDQNNLMEYMKFTQHLNPYGRKRQCDTDLENILLLLDSNLKATIAEKKVLQGKLRKI